MIEEPLLSRFPQTGKYQLFYRQAFSAVLKIGKQKRTSKKLV
jgi:hypothetical protein